MSKAFEKTLGVAEDENKLLESDERDFMLASLNESHRTSFVQAERNQLIHRSHAIESSLYLAKQFGLPRIQFF